MTAHSSLLLCIQSDHQSIMSIEHKCLPGLYHNTVRAAARLLQGRESADGLSYCCLWLSDASWFGLFLQEHLLQEQFELCMVAVWLYRELLDCFYMCQMFRQARLHFHLFYTSLLSVWEKESSCESVNLNVHFQFYIWV